MQPVNLFDLASKQAKWLSVRQTAVAGNIANANTPGYTSGDVEPFDKVLDRGQAVTLAATQVNHFGGAQAPEFEIRHEEPDTAILPSKNTVDLEQELMKAGEVRRGMELNTAIVRSFNSMLMMASKG